MKRPALTRLLGVAALAAGAVLMLIPTSASAKASVDLEQCANGGPTCDTANPGRWITGNLGTSNADYAEGDAVPYRAVLSDLTVGATYRVSIEWDTTKSGKHALDYLVDFDHTETTADPCAGLTCGATTSTLPLPLDPNVSGAGITQIGGQVMTLRGGTFPAAGSSIPNTGNLCGAATCTVPAVTYSLSGTYAGDSTTGTTVWFTASSSTAVLAWGGHIASRVDWGLDNSAASISGSPYHMMLADFACSNAGNCGTGRKDVSLSSAAVTLPASITITKQASPEGTTQFEFSAGPAPLSNFTLVDDGTSSATRTFGGITALGIYTISELPTTDWDFQSIDCSVVGANGGSQTVDGASVTIDLREGEDVTCVFLNEPTPIEAISLSKTADPTVYSAAGDEITYTYVITNTGDATLGPAQFSVDDDMIDGGAPFPCGSSTATLAPAATITCTATYTVTAGDVTAGSVTNTAFATGPVTSGTVTATVNYQPDPIDAISLAKTADPTTYSAAGDEITYTYVVTNSGDTTIGPEQFNVDDDKINGGEPFPCGPSDTTLAPGETITCTATYTVAAADITAGSVTNTAFATGSAASDPVSVTVNYLPDQSTGLGLSKTADRTTYTAAGDVITYTYVITNTGDTKLGPEQFSIDDDKINGGEPFPCGPSDTTLAPGETITCTATYTVVAADLVAGSVVNVAFATGSAASEPDSVTVTFDGVLPFGDDELPVTGVGVGLGGIVIALLVAGTALLAVGTTRRRKDREVSASTRG